MIIDSNGFYIISVRRCFNLRIIKMNLKRTLSRMKILKRIYKKTMKMKKEN